MSENTTAKKTGVDKLIDGIEKVCNKLPPPAILFCWLFLITAIIGCIFSVMGVALTNPASGEVVTSANLFSKDGVDWILGNMVKNFTGFAPLGLVITMTLGIGLLWSSFFVTLVAKKIVLINLCCRPCFIWGSITIITVWTNMIIINVCKFFYLLIECFLCCKLIQICAFILQGIEVTLHRCIVVRISCFAHALCHIYRFAEFGKCFGRIL